MTAKALPFCPFCHQAWSNITENDTEIVLACKNCNQIMTIKSDTSAVESTRANLTYTPDLIISSYEQLITLLKNDEVYGALIKIKDIFELIVRFPLVIILSQVGNKLVRKENDTDFTAEYKSLHKTLQEFMHDVLCYKLSLGNWVTIAGEIKKVLYNKIFTEEADNTCLQTLYNINKINHKAYTDNSITSWRNNTIGHGALNYNKEEVRKDLLDKLNILNNILLENEELYKDIAVSIEENMVSIKSNTSDHVLTVSPFISLEPPDPAPLSAEADVLSIFDSYDQKKHKALNINYNNGEKKHSAELSSALSELADKLKNYDSLSILNKYGSGNITDETIYSLSVEILNKLAERTLSHGSSFSEWFIQCLNRSGGIFLCCAERGMGKSAFAHAVDQLNTVEIKNNQQLKDYLRGNNNSLLIRTYHFNSYYNSDLVTFLARLKDIFTSVLIKNEHEVAYTKSITYISHNIERSYNDLYNAAINESVPIQKKQQLFLKFLKVVQAVWRNSEYQKEKLILFLDGIDEIKNGKNNMDITEWIPSDSKLQEQGLENIYIILTSRHPEEIAGGQNLGSFLAPDRFADTLMLKRVPEKLMYSTYHRDYLEDVKSMLRITEDKRARELADFLEWRYSYLTAYKKIYDFNDNENIAEFMKDPFEAYLKQLGILSKDYCQKVQSLFNLLTTTEEALTLEEISYLLTGDNNPTFQTLDMLMDIGNFLTTERDAVRGNVFKITHPDWVEKIANNKRIQENKQQLLKNLRSMLLDISKQDYDELDFSQKDFDGETWLIANIELFDVDYDNLHSLLVLMDNSHFEKFYHIKRKIKFFTYAISFLKKLADEHSNSERFFYLNNLADSLNIRAIAIVLSNKNPQKALEDLDQVIAIRQQLAKESRRDGTYFDIALLACSLNIRAIVLSNKNPQKALEDLDQAIAIRQQLAEESRLDGTYWEFILALSLTNRSRVLRDINPQKALEDLDQAIAILQQLAEESRRDGTYSDFNILADSLNIRAKVLRNTNPQKALEDLDQAIAIRQQLAEESRRDGTYFDVDNLAGSLNNRAAVLRNTNPQKALEDLEQAIAIRQQLAEESRRDGTYFDVDNLADSLTNRAIVLRNTNPQKALEDLDQAIAIRQQLAKESRREGTYFDFNFLADSLTNRAIVLSDKNPQKALEDLDQAIAIRQQLAEESRREGTYFYVDYLADSLNIRAIVLKNKNPQKALEDLDQAIAIRQQLAEESCRDGTYFDFTLFADSLTNRAMVLKNKNPQKALEDLDQAIAILQQLAEEFRRDGTYFDVDNLAGSLTNRAAVLVNKNPQKALEDLNQAIAIRKQLAEESRRDGTYFDVNLLADSLNNRAIILSDTNPQKALEDLDQAIAIRKQLAEESRRDGTYFDFDLLAGSLNSRAIILSDTNPQKALEDLDEAIAIRQQLAEESRRDGTYFDFDLLADSLDSRAIILSDTNPQKALEDLDQAIAIRQQLAEESRRDGTYFDIGYLADSLNSRAMVLKNKNPQKALEDLDQAIAIRQQLAEESRQDGTYFDFNLLAESLYNKAIILKNLNVDQSVNDCKEAIRILETLKEKNSPYDKDLLDRLLRFKDKYKNL